MLAFFEITLITFLLIFIVLAFTKIEKKKKYLKLLSWVIILNLFTVFYSWYYGNGKPLKKHEIAKYMEFFESRGTAKPERLAILKKFLEEDDGKEFFMLNLIEYREKPKKMKGIDTSQSPQKIIQKYTLDHMLGALLSRAGWFVFAGKSTKTPVEEWNYAGSVKWTNFAIVRYRSRKDMMDIATAPNFRDAHIYKEAALRSTIAYPTAPALLILGPPLFVALLLLSLGLLSHLTINRLNSGGSNNKE